MTLYSDHSTFLGTRFRPRSDLGRGTPSEWPTWTSVLSSARSDPTDAFCLPQGSIPAASSSTCPWHSEKLITHGRAVQSCRHFQEWFGVLSTHVKKRQWSVQHPNWCCQFLAASRIGFVPEGLRQAHPAGYRGHDPVGCAWEAPQSSTLRPDQEQRLTACCFDMRFA